MFRLLDLLMIKMSLSQQSWENHLQIKRKEDVGVMARQKAQG